MYGPQRALGPYEGAFASRVLGQNLELLSPYASAPGGAGAWRAGPGGLLQGRFGWGDPLTGCALNALVTPGSPLGVVLPLRSVNNANGGVIGGPSSFGGPVASWSWETYDRVFKSWRLREGIVTTLMAAGNFWLRFAGGANYGDTVYASQMDGSAISGALDGAIETPWKVCSEASAGSLAMVSTTAKF